MKGTYSLREKEHHLENSGRYPSGQRGQAVNLLATPSEEGWINVDSAMGAKLAKLPYFNTLNRVLSTCHLTQLILTAKKVLRKLSRKMYEICTSFPNALFGVLPISVMYDNQTLLPKVGNLGFNALSREPFDSNILTSTSLNTQRERAMLLLLRGRKNRHYRK